MNPLNKLYSDAIQPIAPRIGFYTKEEFESNYGRLMVLSGCVQSIEKQLKRLSKYEP